MKNGLTNGLLLAVTSIVLFLVINAVNPPLNFNVLYSGLISMATYLFFMIRAGRQERKNYNNGLGFGEAFIPAFTTFAVATFIFNFFWYIMMKNNPHLVDLAIEGSAGIIDLAGKIFGFDTDEIAIELEEQASSEEIRASLTNFKVFLSNCFTSLFIPGMLYAIIAAFFSKKKVTN